MVSRGLRLPYRASVSPRPARRPGALDQIVNRRIDRYQIVTPTQWNASPKDDVGQSGAIEQALIGTVIGDIDQPIEVLRVVHSFDPCLSCAVHLMRPGKKAEKVIMA